MTELRIGSSTGSTTRKPRLIVLDDNPGWGNFVSEVAEKSGYSASYTTNHGEFIGAASADPPDVLVLDLFMPERDGIEMIDDMAQWDDRPLIILISGHSNALLTSAVRLGRSKGLEVVGSLVKPFRLVELRALLQETAGLVDKRNRRRNHIEAADVARKSGRGRRRTPTGGCGHGRVNSSRSRSGAEQGDAFPKMSASDISMNYSLKILRDQVSELQAGELVRNSIAAINTRFCLALWETHRAALTALKDVPARLAEAGRALITEKPGAGQADKWRQALRINMRTLISNRLLIRQIANSLQLVEHGRMTVESIDRLSDSVSELEGSRRQSRSAKGKMSARYKDMCRQSERITQGLSALLVALNDVVKRGQNSNHSDRSDGPTDRDARAENANVVKMPNPGARNANSKSA